MISLEGFERQWLEDIVAGNPSTTQLGHRFAEKILRDWHEIDWATAKSSCATERVTAVLTPQSLLARTLRRESKETLGS